jgi:hypothetical protein
MFEPLRDVMDELLAKFDAIAGGAGIPPLPGVKGVLCCEPC